MCLVEPVIFRKSYSSFKKNVLKMILICELSIMFVYHYLMDGSMRNEMFMPSVYLILFFSQCKEVNMGKWVKFTANLLH